MQPSVPSEACAGCELDPKSEERKISARGQRRDGAENAGSEQGSQPLSSRLFGFWRPLASALAPSLIKSAAAFACRRIFSSRAGLTRRFVERS